MKLFDTSASFSNRIALTGVFLGAILVVEAGYPMKLDARSLSVMPSALSFVKQESEQPTEQDPKESSALQEPTGVPDDTPVTADTSNWINNKPTGAMAEFKTPTKPRLTERMFTPVENQPPIKVRNYLVTFNQEIGLFLFSYHDLFEAPVESAVEETLKGAMLGSLSNVRGRLLSEQKIRYRTNPGCSFEFRFANKEKFFKGIARIFIVGKRQYQVSAIMEEEKFDQQIADAFLGSLRIFEPEPEPESDKKSDNGLNTEADSNDKKDNSTAEVPD